MRIKQPFKQIYYLAPDGTRFYMFDEKRAAQSWQNLGHPDITFIEDSGPNQHGTTVRDWRAQARTISLEYFDQGCYGRQCLYSEVVNAIRLTRQNQPGYLRIINQDTSLVEIPAWIQQGPKGNWNIQDGLGKDKIRPILQFYCNDPIWREVQQETLVLTLEEAGCIGYNADIGSLEMCLPACLGTSLLSADVDICYNGTWPGDQITITIVGPADAPLITNVTTGKSIQLNYNIGSNETVTITILPESTSVTSNINGDIIGTVTNLSDLVNFQLEPKSINNIEFFASNAIDGSTAMVFSYYIRHLSAYDPCDDFCEDLCTNELPNAYYDQVLNTQQNDLLIYLPFSCSLTDHSPNGFTDVTGRSFQYIKGGVLNTSRVSLTTQSTSRINFGSSFRTAFDAATGFAQGSMFGWFNSAGWESSGSLSMLCRLFVDNSNQIYIAKYTPGNAIINYATSSGNRFAVVPNVDNFIFLGLTWDNVANEIKFYVDGVQVGITETFLATIASNIVEAVIGGTSSVYNMQADEVAVWTTALTPTEILNIYNASL